MSPLDTEFRHGPKTTQRCEEHLVLDLAAEAGALLIVSEDADLASMSPWRGVPAVFGDPDRWEGVMWFADGDTSKECADGR